MIIPTIKFVFDRKHRATKNTKGTVDLRITYNRRQKFIATGVRVYPYEWDSKKEAVISLDAATYNSMLADIRAKVLKIIQTQTEAQRIDLDAIHNLLKQDTVDITFLDYIYKRTKAKKVTDHTQRTYRTLLNKLWEYGKLKYFSDVTQKGIRDFSEWLHRYSWQERDRYGRRTRRTYSQASIYKLTSNLSLFISDAVVDGYINENPYITKKMFESKGKTRIDEYLTQEELEKLEAATMPTGSMYEAKDLFLLQCYTGLSYIDLMTYDFTPHRSTEGQILCAGERHKTGVEYFFILTEKSRHILSKYGYRMPKLSNQKYNAKLKIVADAAGIEKPLTSHMGRRTAGSIWLNSGIPVEVVSKCLGHSSIAMTQRAYAKILDKTIIEAFEKIQNKKT